MAFFWLLVLSALAAANATPLSYIETNKKTTRDGHVIWAGDIVLNDEQMEDLKSGFNLRNARKDLRSRWPNGNIPFVVDRNLAHVRPTIDKAVAVWNDETCVTFYEVENKPWDGPHNILKAAGEGCSSWVGIFNTTSNVQTVSLDEGCADEVPTIVHELGHALGLWHEQDRPDREQHLKIYLDNMKESDRIYFETSLDDVMTYGVPYDYGSIMQYNAYAFSGNGRMTLVPKDPLAEAIMSYAKGPTFNDYKMVNLMYNCTSRCSNMQCSNGGYASFTQKKGCRCLCPPGFGGDKCQNTVPLEKPCTFTITTPSTIKTPNHPGFIPANSHCAWLIKTPRGKTATVSFKTFNLLDRDEKKECVWDSLRVRQGDLQSDDPGKVYCGDKLQSQQLRTQGEMLLVLSSSQYNDYSTGFEADVKFV